MSPRPIRRNPQLPRLEAPLERRYGLMAEPLRFRTNDPILLGVADAAFGRFDVPDAGTPLEIELVVDGSVRPGASRAVPATDRGALMPRVQGRVHTIVLDAGNHAVVDLERGVAVGVVSPDVAADGAFVRYAFVEAMGLSMLGRARGYVAIHASGVVHRDRGAVIQAAAGTGKSTLAVACARFGLGVLAEDVVFARALRGEVELWGLPWTQRLLPDSVERFPELAGAAARLQANGEHKIEIDVEATWPGAARPHAPGRAAVILVRGSGGPTRIEPLDPDDAAAELEVLWPWGDGWTAGHEATVRTLLAEGAGRLHMNGSPEAAAEALATWLDR
jgi:hypothetical protein